MLRIAKMEISGFKSFSDKTEVLFPAGVTSIVGPNGCGKSNIGDAINWVLGEQSAKILRGKQMADVIFNGSAARKPVGLAQVSIHLSGSEGLKHDDNGQIVVTRRLFRSGESEYLLNGKRARLKDIQELLSEGRVGVRTYATIEQGKIDHILNSKPQDRRMIIEDAAGVSGYKHKRRLTELKLEATEANLLRVNDIVVEVERQIRSLKRQASKARRYRKLRDELRNKQALRFGMRAAELNETLARLGETDRRAKDAESEAAARLSRLEVSLLEERSSLERDNQEFRETSERAHQLEMEIDRQEARIQSCKEKIVESEQTAGRHSSEAGQLSGRHAEAMRLSDQQRLLVEQGRETFEQASAELGSWQAAKERAELERNRSRDGIEELRSRQFDSMNRIAELRNRLHNAEDAFGRGSAQHQRLTAEMISAADDLSRLQGEADDWASQSEKQRQRVEALQLECERSEQQLAQARDALSADIDVLTESRELEKSTAARLVTLEDVATRFAGVSDGVRTLLSDGAAAGVRALGVAADFIEAGSDIENLAEGYLRGFLPTVILEDDGDVHRAAKMLRSAGAGRTNLISKSQPAGRPAVGVSANGHGELPLELLRDPRIKGRLRDQLTLHSSANGVVQDRIGEAVLVDSLESALDLHRNFPTVDYLTLSGDVVYASGVVSAGGLQSGDQGLLAHSRRTEETRTHAREASNQVSAQQRQVESSRGEVESLEAELHDQRLALDEAKKRHVELTMQAGRFSEERERGGRRAEVLGDELSGLQRETGALEQELRELRRLVAEAEQANSALEQDLRSRIEAFEQQEEKLPQLTEQVAALRERFAANRQQQESMEQEAARLAESAGELQARVRAAEAEVEAAAKRAGEAAELRAETERELLCNLEESRQLEEKGAKLQQEIAERRLSLEEHDNELRTAREQLETLRESRRDSELELTKMDAERRHLDDLCMQELGVRPQQASTELHQALDEVDLDELEEEIEGIKGKIDRIGPVNMESIDEFSELEERHLFLTSQRQDLEQSMTSLKETIRRINRASRERFIKVFEAVRSNYQEIFKSLFNGGRADLRLEEGEDVLECGVEILAQPPGKRLGSVQLLSGGEKALSAIALLFAIFRAQPSPFCLLDEVDAALDDSNIGRFTRMVREYAEYTQFIIITHNKLSMESADLLYGVTMAEPGVSRLVSMELH